jgi:glycosyltransferase involved in cell wall biosynthesis
MSGIGVVIPTYNRAGLLGETLDAVLAQHPAPADVIVVDDGSTDDTPDLLAGYGARVRHIPIANSGDMVARNVGLHAAATPLVAFCDSDDVWQPGFLAAMLAHWQAEPDLLACYGDFRILGAPPRGTKFDDAPAGFWDGLRATGPQSGVFDTPVAERLLSFQPFFPSAMAVARAAFIALGGWDEGVSRILGCDFATALRVAARPKLGVVRRPLVAIRKHAGNISADSERMELGDALVLEHVLRTRAELAPLADKIRASVARRRRAALDSAFARRDFAAVRDIDRLLPPGALPAKQRLKRAIAALPDPVAATVAALVGR